MQSQATHRADSVLSAGETFEVFYDGDCPLCMREINMIMRKDVEHKIRFTNIADPGFKPEELGMSWERLMKKIHGRMPDGTFIEGVEVFRQLYAAIGFERLVGLSRAPGIAQVLQFGYSVFAKNRLRFTGRCTDACEVPQQKVAEAHS
jgi:predicted DCC family thiol-disulfide oxidoreductase YuxK